MLRPPDISALWTDVNDVGVFLLREVFGIPGENLKHGSNDQKECQNRDQNAKEYAYHDYMPLKMVAQSRGLPDAKDVRWG